MSVLRMTERAVRRPAEVRAASADTESALQRIVDYIPSEVTALYIGLGGILPRTDAIKWGVFALGLLLVPAFILFALETARRKTAEARLSLRDFALLALFGWLAYVIWVAAIPDTPLLYFHSDINVWAGAAALVCAVILPRIAQLVGLDKAHD